MKRLVYPVLLVSLSLMAAAMITTVLAKTMASFDHSTVVTAADMALR